MSEEVILSSEENTKPEDLNLVEKLSQNSETKSAQPLEIAKTIVKRKYKKRRFPEPQKFGSYIITPIYKNTFYESTECYFTGEILVDFSKMNMSSLDMYSPWNQFKNINCSSIDQLGRLLITKLDDKMYTLLNQDHILQKYKNYPNQDVQDLVECLVNVNYLLKRINQVYEVMISQYNNNSLLVHQIRARDDFQSKTHGFYRSLGKNCRFLARHFGPDLIKKKMQFYQQVCSESLSELLGLTIEQSQSQIHRQGIFDFFDFETIAYMQRQLMKQILKRFQGNSVIPEEFSEYTQPMNLKFTTFDEITFYADVTVQTYSHKKFNPELKIYSIYFAILFMFNVSPSMEMSIKEQRKAQQNQGINQPFVGDITYTIQSEIFQDKFLTKNAEANGGTHNSFNENKVCGYRIL